MYGQQEDNYISPWAKFKRFISQKFELHSDQAAEDEVRANIRKGVDFQGTNLWVLIFAIFIASIGLNVNSTAVIIGAMLISPIMGPIMGIGLSLGVSNFDLMKRSLKNLGFSVIVGLATSTLYFLVSPISTAQSELLARTTPTIYDVLIAFFGGLAGVVAQTRKDRTSTVIPGVAIATALMPPLCTAGYGLALGNMHYFIGALYLFFINTVFIALGTYIIVRFVLKYKKIAFIDKKRDRQVRNYMTVIVVLTLIPSIILAYGIVQETIYNNNAQNYINKVLNFEGTQVVNPTKIEYSNKGSKIEVTLIGENVSEEVISMARGQLETYHLRNTNLIVHQVSSSPGTFDSQTLQSVLVNNTQLIEEKNRKIDELEKEIHLYSRDTLPAADISHEMSTLWNDIRQVSITRAPQYTGKEGVAKDTIVLCYIKTNNLEEFPEQEQNKMTEWLQTRTKAKNIRLIIDK